ALLAQVVGQLVRGDGEQVRLHVALLVVVGQAREEPDEGLLHDVLAGRAVAQPAVDEGEQPPLVPLDQLPPGLGVAGAHRPDQECLGVGRGHRSPVAPGREPAGRAAGFNPPPVVTPAPIVNAPAAACLSSASASALPRRRLGPGRGGPGQNRSWAGEGPPAALASASGSVSGQRWRRYARNTQRPTGAKVVSSSAQMSLSNRPGKS